MNYIQFLFCGALGGLARGLLGAYKKSLNIGERKKLNWEKMGLNIVASTIIGSLVGLIVDHNPVTAACAGYAGIDIIESVVKLSK